MASLTAAFLSYVSWFVLIMLSKVSSAMSSKLEAVMSKQTVPLSNMLLNSKSECSDNVAT
jgi:hypothetical protein